MFLNTDIFSFYVIAKNTLINSNTDFNLYTSVINDIFAAKSVITSQTYNELEYTFNIYQ